MYDLPPSLLTRLHFYRTTAYPCSYLPGQTACSKVATPSHLINSQTFSDLLALGFRRSGIFTYRPDCDHCKACIPLRVPVADFRPSRSQCRAHKQHAQLITRVERLSFKQEHFALYQLYQRTRHPGGGMDQDSQQHYTEFLLQSGTQTVLVEFRDPTRPAQQDLVMVSIIDVLDHGLSAVYTFYTPEPEASYGTYNVLWQIQYAQALGLPYLYLGYWVEQSEKMHYKAQYRPHEIWQQGQWHRVPTAQARSA